MVYFPTKNPNLGKFWTVLQWKMLVYCVAIRSIFRPFGILYVNLVHFVVIWCIFPVLVYCTNKNLATLVRALFNALGWRIKDKTRSVKEAVSKLPRPSKNVEQFRKMSKCHWTSFGHTSPNLSGRGALTLQVQVNKAIKMPFARCLSCCRLSPRNTNFHRCSILTFWAWCKSCTQRTLRR
jgi:hypothetical protein